MSKVLLVTSSPRGAASHSTKIARTLADQLASAEAIVEDIGNSAVPSLDDFQTVTFSNLVVNGEPFASAGTSNITTIQRGTRLLSSESSLGSEGFSITWLHR